MKTLCLALAAALVAPIAHAQLSVYGSIALTNYGYDSNGSLAYKPDTGGLIGGVLYNFPIQSRVTVGIDTRASYSVGEHGGEFVTSAVRVAFVPASHHMSPYFELGGGVVTSTFNNTQLNGLNVVITTATRRTSGALEFAGGLDIRLTRHVDLRAVELGAAGGSVGTAFLDAGVVYHFGKRS